jgi:F-box interacting protein
MASYLPEDVVVKILSRLPPKCLIRFKSVSKRWRALIGNPDFLSKNLLNHSILTQNPSRPLRLILFLATEKYVAGEQIHFLHSFRSYDSLRCASQALLNFPPLTRHFEIVASCNGLLCLWDQKLDDIYLWNPATSSDLEALPRAPSRCHTRRRFPFYDFNVGFGFDSGSNDFKLVTLVDTGEDGWLEAEIYSLRSGSWRLLDMKVNFEMLSISQTAALDGVFLWYDDFRFGDCVADDRIVAFDFTDEEFRIMQSPDARLFCDYGQYTRTLTELKGSVAMMVFPYDDRKKKNYLDIWVMLEFGVSESWTRLLIIQLPLHLERPLMFWKNGELFMENSEGQVVLYDLLAQTEMNLQFGGSRVTSKVVDCNFVQFEGMAPCP